MSSTVQNRRTGFSRSGERLRWPQLGLALGLTGAQILFLLLAWNVHSEQSTRPADLIEVPTLPDPPVPPKPVPPPIVPEAVAEPSATPPPAPAVAPVQPEPVIVLTDTLVPLSPVTPIAPSDLAGDGLVPSVGDGNGTGTGNGRGNGSGTGAADGRFLTVSWAPTMRFRRLRNYYPRSAMRDRIAGVARLDCEIIERDRVRDCRLLGETPAGLGFGTAALEAQGVFRLRLHDQNGDRVYNERVVVNARFQPPG